jgi:hypothetical protein
MKYAVEMGSSVMIYIPSFVKIGSRNSEVHRRDSRPHRHTEWRLHKPTVGN